MNIVAVVDIAYMDLTFTFNRGTNGNSITHGRTTGNE